MTQPNNSLTRAATLLEAVVTDLEVYLDDPASFSPEFLADVLEAARMSLGIVDSHKE